MDEGQPPVGANRPRSVPWEHHWFRSQISKPLRRHHHVHLIPWRCAHEDVENAHPAPHCVLSDIR